MAHFTSLTAPLLTLLLTLSTALRVTPRGGSGGPTSLSMSAAKSSSPGCVDTAGWFSEPYGYTCEDYVTRGWCRSGFVEQSPRGIFMGGLPFNFPEDNCCACGKDPASLAGLDPEVGPPKPAFNVTSAGAHFLQELNTCLGLHSCTSCGASPKCGWCAGPAGRGGDQNRKGRCVAGSSQGPAMLGETNVAAELDRMGCSNWHFAFCPNVKCEDYTSCSACAADSYCGWCSATSTCIEGDARGPLGPGHPSEAEDADAKLRLGGSRKDKDEEEEEEGGGEERPGRPTHFDVCPRGWIASPAPRGISVQGLRSGPGSFAYDGERVHAILSDLCAAEKGGAETGDASSSGSSDVVELAQATKQSPRRQAQLQWESMGLHPGSSQVYWEKSCAPCEGEYPNCDCELSADRRKRLLDAAAVPKSPVQSYPDDEMPAWARENHKEGPLLPMELLRPYFLPDDPRAMTGPTGPEMPGPMSRSDIKGAQLRAQAAGRAVAEAAVAMNRTVSMMNAAAVAIPQDVPRQVQLRRLYATQKGDMERAQLQYKKAIASTALRPFMPFGTEKKEEEWSAALRSEADAVDILEKANERGDGPTADWAERRLDETADAVSEVTRALGIATGPDGSPEGEWHYDKLADTLMLHGAVMQAADAVLVDANQEWDGSGCSDPGTSRTEDTCGRCSNPNLVSATDCVARGTCSSCLACDTYIDSIKCQENGQCQNCRSELSATTEQACGLCSNLALKTAGECEQAGTCLSPADVAGVTARADCADSWKANRWAEGVWTGHAKAPDSTGVTSPGECDSKRYTANVWTASIWTPPRLPPASEEEEEGIDGPTRKQRAELAVAIKASAAKIATALRGHSEHGGIGAGAAADLDDEALRALGSNPGGPGMVCDPDRAEDECGPREFCNGQHEGGGSPVCECGPEYIGATCEECAKGHHEEGEVCVANSPAFCAAMDPPQLFCPRDEGCRAVCDGDAGCAYHENTGFDVQAVAEGGGKKIVQCLPSCDWDDGEHFCPSDDTGAKAGTCVGGGGGDPIRQCRDCDDYTAADPLERVCKSVTSA